MSAPLNRQGFADGLRDLAAIRRALEGAVRASEMRHAETEARLAHDRRLIAFVDACAEIYRAGLAAADAAEAAAETTGASEGRADP